MRRTAFGAVFAALTLSPAIVSPALAADAAAPAENGPLVIVVYDQPNFKGRELKLTAAVPDLSAVKFDDKVASLTISGAGDWVLCENRNYGGRCSRVQGKAENLGLLQLAGRVSSLYPVPATPAATPAAP
jgi:hypothetical protein